MDKQLEGIVKSFGFKRASEWQEQDQIYIHKYTGIYINLSVTAVSNIITVLVKNAYDEGFEAGSEKINKALGIDKILERLGKLELEG